MQSRQIIIAVIAIFLVLGALAALAHVMRADRDARPVAGDSAALGNEQPAAAGSRTSRGAPTFAWSYRSVEGGEIPHSEIYLTARYGDGTQDERKIDTIEGSCNEYAEPDADIYAKSQMIICYYAGLGRYYKVVEQPEGFEVMRRQFEEGTPDTEPARQPFETVATFYY